MLCVHLQRNQTRTSHHTLHVFDTVHHAVQHHTAAIAAPEYTWVARTHAMVSPVT